MNTEEEKKEKTYSTSPQSLSKLCSGDIGSRGTLWYFVNGLVLVCSRQVGHSLERNHLDMKLIFVLSNKFLSIVRTVKVFSLRVFTRSSMITTDNLPISFRSMYRDQKSHEVGSTKVLPDNRVP